MLRLIHAVKTKPILRYWPLSICFGTSNKKYILSQFPYPSGELHLGHARVYYIGDTLARYYKLRNFQVIYPIGFDSFGLPAENAAIVHGKNPKVWTQNNITQMKTQLRCLNINFDWDREICTHRPQYYRWTQQIFTSMFQKGLVYKAQSQVNWDPVDKTVLANEQVDDEGRSWRSGALVEKKMLSQWFFKITAYAEELQSNLNNLEWIDRVKSMQAGWIGFKKGHQVTMKVHSLNKQIIGPGFQDFDQEQLRVFVEDLDWLNQPFYVRYNLTEKRAWLRKDDQEVIGQLINPVSKEIVPIVFGQQQNGVRLEIVLKMKSKEEKMESGRPICSEIESQPISVMRLRDWSISRQRYWGTPIPIIYCRQCGTVPVPEQELPVPLPEWRGEGNPLLSTQFKHCRCPKCGGEAERESDTMDTFVDSSWYFLRFLDSLNTRQLCDKAKNDFWMPVDIYIGGIEHAIMHLLYARFFMRVLFDLNVCSIKQPFKQLVVQGLVKGKAIKHKATGKYLRTSQIPNYSASEIEESYQKMSKSKFNGLNPQHLVEKFGPDALRVALFFASPPENDIDFHEDLLLSAERFLKKVEDFHRSIEPGSNPNRLSFDSHALREQIRAFSSNYPSQSLDLKRIVAKLEISLEKRHMHVCVANAMELFNQIKEIGRKNDQHGQIGAQLFCHVFAPILSIIAPLTTTALFQLSNGELDRISWPHSSYFVDFVEYLVMRGNKMVKKGVIQLEEEQINEVKIRAQLRLADSDLIKINKKVIVIITK